MQLKLYMVTLEELMPPEHFLRKVDAVLDLSFVRGGKPHICFKKELGVGFADYVSALWLERAKELLRDGKVKIKDIHSQVGFTSAHYFGTWFKKNTGVTPSEFRKQ